MSNNKLMRKIKILLLYLASNSHIHMTQVTFRYQNLTVKKCGNQVLIRILAKELPHLQDKLKATEKQEEAGINKITQQYMSIMS